ELLLCVPAASLGPTALAGEREKPRRIRFRQRVLEGPLAAAKNEAVIRRGRCAAGKLVRGRAHDVARVRASRVETEEAGAPKRLGGDLAIVVFLGEQDAGLVTRPAGPVGAIDLVQEVEIQARLARVFRACLLPVR